MLRSRILVSNDQRSEEEKGGRMRARGKKSI
jgi:hypothetical protein